MATSNSQSRRRAKSSAKLRRAATPSPEQAAKTRFFHPGLGRWVINVAAESFYVTADDDVIFTTLGSCVSACVHDPVLGIGGLNHFLLPRRPEQDTVNAALRYGCHSMERMLNELFKMGATRGSLETKVFGGSSSEVTGLNVGRSNVEFVLDYLDGEGMAITGGDVGGVWARQLRYYPRTGRVLVRRIAMGRRRDVAEEERQLLTKVVVLPGSVELFEEPEK